MELQVGRIPFVVSRQYTGAAGFFMQVKACSLRDKNLSSKEKDEMLISLTDARRSAIDGIDHHNRGDF